MLVSWSAVLCVFVGANSPLFIMSVFVCAHVHQGLQQGFGRVALSVCIAV